MALRRADRGCSRLDLEPVHWLINPQHLARYLGRRPDPRLEGERLGPYPVDWKRPFEDLEDGCPRGWVDNPFTVAMRPFVPRRTTTGAYDRNYRLERCEDWLVQDAVDLFLDYQERCLAEMAAHRRKLAEQKKG